MSDIGGIIRQFSISAVPLLLAITFHEAAHGYVAERKGDPTARMLGRVTLNPLAHVDPIGTILLPAILILTNSPFLFGWAKPVPVNFRLLRNQKTDPVYVAAAGVVTNMMLAFAAGLVLQGIGLLDPVSLRKAMFYARTHLFPSGDGGTQTVLLPLALMCVAAVKWNVLLAIFNLIPIPPLDGGRIAVGLLPYGPSQALASVERYGMLILIVLLMFDPFGVIRGILYPVMSFLFSLFLGG